MTPPELLAVANATAPSKPEPVAITHARVDQWQSWFGRKDGFLNKYTVEREDVNFIQGLCVISGTDYLQVGPPGVGKTYSIELMCDFAISGAKLFTALLAKDMSANEVLGPQSLNALKEDRIRRVTEGMLPEANIGYLDEFFKASAPTLNPMLTLMAERKLKTGGHVMKCDKLLTIAMSSNELPTGREDLGAIRDRVDLTLEVENVNTPEGWRRVIEIQCDIRRNGIDTDGRDPFSADELLEVRREVMAVVLPPNVVEILVECLGKFQKADHLPSMRRVERMQRMMMAHAWAHGREEVVPTDVLPIAHMAWNDKDHAKSAHDIVDEYLGDFHRKARAVRTRLNPVLGKVRDLQRDLDKAKTREEIGALMRSGTDFLTELDGFGREIEEILTEGKQLGEDVSSVEEVQSDLRKAYGWAHEALSKGFAPPQLKGPTP